MRLWFSGEYTFDGCGRWKGELMSEPCALAPDPAVVFENQIVSIGSSGTSADDAAETIDTCFVGKRPIAFCFTMHRS